jgi:hypothetical protein
MTIYFMRLMFTSINASVIARLVWQQRNSFGGMANEHRKQQQQQQQ